MEWSGVGKGPGIELAYLESVVFVYQWFVGYVVVSRAGI